MTDIKILLPLIGAILNFDLGLLLAFDKNKTNGKIFAVLLACAIALWSGLITLFYFVESAPHSLLVGKALHVSGGIIASFFLLFSLSFFGKKIGVHALFLIAANAILAVLYFATDAMLSGMADFSGAKGFLYGPLQPLFYIFFFGIFGLGFYNFFSKYQKISDQVRRQIRLIVAGSAIALVCAGTTNVLFSELGIFHYLWLGPFLVIVWPLSITYAIIRLHLFNAKIILTEIFVLLLGNALFLRLVLSYPNELFLNTGFLALFLLVGYIMIQGAIKEVAQREEIEQFAGDLSDANKHLREMDRMKSEFVLIASHQLRAPLTAIKGYASMFAEGSFGKLSKDMTLPMERILQSAENLIGLIEGFLNLSRIERGALFYQFVSVDIKQLAREVWEEFEPRAKEKNLKLSLEEEQGDYRCIADPGKMRQIISNLVDNSIKYTLAGEVHMHLSYKQDKEGDREPAKIVLCVSDTGIGIKQDDMPHLFQRFSRGSKEGGRKLYTEGTGLGLYVAKEMIEAHHGRIWAESEGPGKGAKFCIELTAKR